MIIPLDNSYLIYEHRKVLNFCSEDYLGLANHSDLKKRAIKFLLEHGTSAASTFFSQGKLECQRLIEEKFAQLLGVPHVALFPSLLHLQEVLEKQTCSLITVESLQRNGQRTDLPSLADRSQARLYVDDTRAFGVMGKQGMGLASHVKGIDFIAGTLTLAGGIAYLGSQEKIDGYSLTPAALGTLDALLDLLPQMEGERGQLEQRAYRLRTSLQQLGFSIPSTSHLLSLKFECQKEAEKTCRLLFEHEMLAQTREEQLLLAINIHHTPDQLEMLAQVLMQSLMEAPRT